MKLPACIRRSRLFAAQPLAGKGEGSEVSSVRSLDLGTREPPRRLKKRAGDPAFKQPARQQQNAALALSRMRQSPFPVVRDNIGFLPVRASSHGLDVRALFRQQGPGLAVLRDRLIPDIVANALRQAVGRPQRDRRLWLTQTLEKSLDVPLASFVYDKTALEQYADVQQIAALQPSEVMVASEVIKETALDLRMVPDIRNEIRKTDRLLRSMQQHKLLSDDQLQQARASLHPTEAGRRAEAEQDKVFLRISYHAQARADGVGLSLRALCTASAGLSPEDDRMATQKMRHLKEGRQLLLALAPILGEQRCRQAMRGFLRSVDLSVPDRSDIEWYGGALKYLQLSSEEKSAIKAKSLDPGSLRKQRRFAQHQGAEFLLHSIPDLMDDPEAVAYVQVRLDEIHEERGPLLAPKHLLKKALIDCGASEAQAQTLLATAARIPPGVLG